MTDQVPTPVRVCVLNDYPVVVRGVAALLVDEPGVRVVEVAVGLPEHGAVDVVLYDTFGQQQGNLLDIGDIVDRTGAQVVVYSWNLAPALLTEAVRRGAAAYLPKTLDGAALAAALLRVRAGELLLPEDVGVTEVTVAEQSGAFPGREHGLSARESEMIALVARGHSNAEIAELSYLSINSVKTYLRTGYRKLGISRRAQAVVWAVEHGLGRQEWTDPGQALDKASTE